MTLSEGTVEYPCWTRYHVLNILPPVTLYLHMPCTIQNSMYNFRGVMPCRASQVPVINVQGGSRKILFKKWPIEMRQSRRKSSNSFPQLLRS